MDTSKFSVKVYVEDPAGAGRIEDLVPVFHSWIQMHSISDHLLIDVADYAHVHHGPGIVLVAHEANYSADQQHGRLGLTYQRKRPIDGPLGERLRVVFRSALQAAALLEQAPELDGRIKFRTDELQFRIHDRLIAPNTPETFAAVRDDLQEVADELYGDGAEVQLDPRSVSPRELFEVVIRSTQSGPLTKLLENLSAVAAGEAATTPS